MTEFILICFKLTLRCLDRQDFEEKDFILKKNGEGEGKLLVP